MSSGGEELPGLSGARRVCGTGGGAGAVPAEGPGAVSVTGPGSVPVAGPGSVPVAGPGAGPRGAAGSGGSARASARQQPRMPRALPMVPPPAPRPRGPLKLPAVGRGTGHEGHEGHRPLRRLLPRAGPWPRSPAPTAAQRGQGRGEDSLLLGNVRQSQGRAQTWAQGELRHRSSFTKVFAPG